MDEGFQAQAGEWFERGQHDIETAQLVYGERGYTDVIALHIHQALEKYLKGYLILNGKKPPRIHELDTLLNHVVALDSSLNDFIELCEKASRFYIEDRYPPGPPAHYEYNEIESDLESAWQLIRRIRAKAGI